MKVFHDLLDRSPGQLTGAVAIRHEGQDLSYPLALARTTRLAAGLRELGVQKFDRVAVCLTNQPAVVELAIACSRLNAIFVPINPAFRTRQLLGVLEDCAPRVFVATDTAISRCSEGLARHPNLRILPIRTGDTSAQHGPTPLEQLLAAPERNTSPRPMETDPAAILYTSGSTGSPKGVVVSHRNLVQGAACVSRYLGNSPDDRILAALPLSFDYGLSQVTTSLYVGASAVLTQYALPAALVAEVAAERITGLAGVPTMWTYLARVEWPPTCKEQLRYITSSGGVLPESVIKILLTRLPGTRLFSMYGLTEAFRSTYLEPEQLVVRPGSIGRAIPEQDVFVARADGTRCAPEEEGELVHRGSLVSLGYWADPELTATRFKPLPPLTPGAPTTEIGVWSGDRVKTDAEGYLYFVGRADDQIKTSGYRIHPREIEDVIAEVDGVTAVAVVGLSDVALGQRIGVAVCSTGDGADLVARIHKHCQRELPPYMQPTEIVLATTLPITPNKKIDRKAVLSSLFGKSPAA